MEESSQSSSLMPSPAARITVWVVTAIILLGLIARLGLEVARHGQSAWHSDLTQFFAEQQSFYGRHYPSTSVSNAGAAPWHSRQNSEAVQTAFPPYSFPIWIGLIPPRWSYATVERWFFVLQLLAVGSIARYAWKCGRGVESELAVILSITVVGITGVRADLIFGNFALIAMAFILALHHAIERGRWWLAAGFWVLAMVKPQMGWAFAAMFCHPKGIRPLLAAIVGLLALALATFAWTGTNILDVVHSGGFDKWGVLVRSPHRSSLPALLASLGISAPMAVWISLASGIAALGVVIRLSKRSEWLLRFAAVAIIGRIFIYHNVCDDVLLAFAIVWLGRHAWSGGRAISLLAFLLLGATAWAPTAAISGVAAIAMVLAVWFMILVYVVTQFEGKRAGW